MNDLTFFDEGTKANCLGKAGLDLEMSRRASTREN
jgi:hypothetical protein